MTDNAHRIMAGIICAVALMSCAPGALAADLTNLRCEDLADPLGNPPPPAEPPASPRGSCKIKFPISPSRAFGPPGEHENTRTYDRWNL